MKKKLHVGHLHLLEDSDPKEETKPKGPEVTARDIVRKARRKVKRPKALF